MPALLPVRLPPGPAGLQALVGPLGQALEGRGPAIAPVPTDLPAAVTGRLRAALAPDLPVDPTVAAVVSTSGSTGDPAGVVLPGAALRASAGALHAWHVAHTGARSARPLRWLAGLPLHSIGGLMCVVRSLVSSLEPVAAPWLGGAQPFTAGGFLDCTDALPTDTGVGWAVSLVPTMLARVLDHPAGGVALACFDLVLVGGAAAAPDLLTRAREAGANPVASYGMTETCGGAVMNGQPVPGVTVTAQGGLLRLGGPVVAAGYRDGRRPQAWGRDDTGRRWFTTSDRGVIAPDGTVRVLGRADDVVTVGGVNVDVAAVERVLRGHPGVRESAVTTVADPLWGTRLEAHVVAREAGAAHDALQAQLRESLATQLGRAAVPRSFAWWDALPTLPGGKIDRLVLAGRRRDGQDPDPGGQWPA